MAETDDHPRRRWRPLRSARARILTAFLVLLAGSTLVSDLALRQLLTDRVRQRVDADLAQEADEFRTLARQGQDPRTGEPFRGDVRAIFDVFLGRNVPGEGESFFTLLDGRPYSSDANAPRSGPLVELVRSLGATSRVTRDEVELATGTFRYLAVPVIVGDRSRGTFVVTEDLGNEEAEVTDALRIAVGVSLVVLLVAGGVAFVIAGRVLAPLRDLSDTARSITESDLTRRIAASGDDEIAELARTFDAMLDRLEGAFDSQRDFISDAGHELRTPITIVRGHLELLSDDPQERRDTVELVTSELDRMSRIVDDLLTLAKAERSDFLRPGDVDLDALTEELMAKAEALAPRDWRLSAVGAGRITADRQRLTQAVMNLAANAAQHTGPGDRIELGSALTPRAARLWVRDSGPGVPAAERERIFERFARASDGHRRSEGAGLGLAIVRAIATAHGGRVDLTSRPGHGALFTITVPLEPPKEVATP